MKERLKVFAIPVVSVLLVVALALAFRFFIARQPPAPPQPPEQHPKPVPRQVQKPVVAVPGRLMSLPPSEWDAAAKAARPRLHAWLEAHARLVFPWDKTAEFRRKVPMEHFGGWADLFKSMAKENGKAADAAEKRLKSAEDELGEQRRLLERVREAVGCLEDDARTNSAKIVYHRETLARGRFWGWNRKRENVVLADSRAAAQTIADERRRIARIEGATEQVERDCGRLSEELKALNAEGERIRTALARAEDDLRALSGRKLQPSDGELAAMDDVAIAAFLAIIGD